MTRVSLAVLITTLVLAWLTSANGALRRVESAYELEIQQIRLPEAVGGRVIIRPCVGCRLVVLRVDEATTYHLAVNGPPVMLPELLRAVDAVGTRDDGLIYVFYQADSDLINRIVLSTR